MMVEMEGSGVANLNLKWIALLIQINKKLNFVFLFYLYNIIRGQQVVSHT